MRRFLLPLVLAAVAVVLFQPPARAIETSAREAVVLDYATGQILFEKRARQPMPPASMTKLMTAYIVFDRLRQTDLSMDDRFQVSEKAWRMRGSRMFVEVGSDVPVEDLLQGLIVQSGNDAATVLAEGLAGSVDAFAATMNAYAERLDMPATHFDNPTGWPDPDHRTSALGLARLARALIRDFPDHYARFFSQRSYTWNGIEQRNRNPLLGKVDGLDGLKTGYTRNAGYGLTASAERDGQRVITVVNGLDRPNGRADESAKLLAWAFREFRTLELFEAGETVDEAGVWMGERARVPLVLDRPLALTLRADAADELKVTASYDAPIPAPIAKGQRLGTLTVEAPDQPKLERALKAGEDVAELGPFGRLTSSLQYLLTGAQ